MIPNFLLNCNASSVLRCDKQVALYIALSRIATIYVGQA